MHLAVGGTPHRLQLVCFAFEATGSSTTLGSLGCFAPGHGTRSFAAVLQLAQRAELKNGAPEVKAADRQVVGTCIVWTKIAKALRCPRCPESSRQRSSSSHSLGLREFEIATSSLAKTRALVPHVAATPTVRNSRATRWPHKVTSDRKPCVTRST